MALLVGGSNLAGWRNDAELINDKNFTKKIADFPYTIDAPYGFWSGPTGGVVVCGGKNWDEDITETRCWRYLHCTDTWTQLYTDLPVPSSGGVGVPVQYSSGEWGLWILGGGNGVDAIDNVQILSTEGENLVWSEGPRLIHSRYGHCAFLNPVTQQIHVFGGRDNQNILKSMEILNIEAATSQVVEDWNFAENRWGALCQTYQDSQGQMKVKRLKVKLK
ncbi:uncharacterized protein LOC111703888 isoform X1 [Eurytemora carolleeae]|uniref:uncharacterized protein LOC111703888 isoform X1 n=1 Tax=Eurytemora carolleeae TaxID=1294199 RepID=UPI000C76F45B|nr:uncharacterized protein LOC111703888 isoform X1 [Eurytemora carolleeae]|eukprot:XP_023331741.1 uncharacterized protein LOC111703888 isoform X1 [Eurytemora affinis]